MHGPLLTNDFDYGNAFARAIVDTIHDPLIILDGKLCVVDGSQSFYTKFDLTPETARGVLFFDLNNGQWDIPALRTLLKEVLPKHKRVKDYEVSCELPYLGQRILCINAKEILDEKQVARTILISIFDVTEQRTFAAEREKLIRQKDVLLKEMRHRIANSLQLIASILLLKAAAVNSKESRVHLEDAHERILSIANIQQQLEPSGIGDDIPVARYLTDLCSSLERSMIGGRKAIHIVVNAGPGTVSSDTAISFGLVTTELVINSLKYAFLDNQPGTVTVSYESSKSGWMLSVADNGVSQAGEKEGRFPGLGTSIIGAIANQMHAVIRTESSPDGTRVSLTRHLVT